MKAIIKADLKYACLAALMAAGISLSPATAFADLFDSGWGAAVGGQIGVSTHINNTPVYSPLGPGIDARNRRAYTNDAQERTVRQRATTRAFQDTTIAPADIAPAAGDSGYVKPQPIYNTGRIRGGHSYND